MRAVSQENPSMNDDVLIDLHKVSSAFLLSLRLYWTRSRTPGIRRG